MKKTLATLGGVLAIFLCLPWGMAQQPKRDVPATDKEQQFSFWMGNKLQESQSIFAALAQADFPTIMKSTKGLKGLTKLEAFVRRSSPEYRTQLRSFEFAVNEMHKQAKAKNIEGVVLAFNQMTLSCVHCHQQVRAPLAEQSK